MKTKNIIKTIATLSSVAGLIVAIGFGCGLGFQPIGLGGNVVDGSIGSTLGIGGENQTLDVIVGVRTTQVPIYTNVYNSYLSCLEVTPNNAITQELDRQVGSFSGNGSALSVNSPLLFSYISLAAAICQKKIDDERGLASVDRMIFNAVDLNGAPDNVDMASLGETVNRIARSCWQRNEDSEELSEIVSSFNEADAAGAGNDGAETRNLMLILCTGMLASTSGYEM